MFSFPSELRCEICGDNADKFYMGRPICDQCLVMYTEACNEC
jgi:hypothetical protein